MGVVNADETTDDQESIILELISSNSDGILNTEQFSITDEELFEIENIISNIFENLEGINDWGQFLEVLKNLNIRQNSIISRVIKILTKSKITQSRSFIISSGHGYSFSPLQKNQFKLRKKFTFWHYSSDERVAGRTLIIQPLKFKIKLLRGTQFGFMNKFTGIYLNIKRSLPEKSYTFFMGMARTARGMDFSTSPQYNL